MLNRRRFKAGGRLIGTVPHWTVVGIVLTIDPTIVPGIVPGIVLGDTCQCGPYTEAPSVFQVTSNRDLATVTQQQ
jgi:hypothetical protein